MNNEAATAIAPDGPTSVSVEVTQNDVVVRFATAQIVTCAYFAPVEALKLARAIVSAADNMRPPVSWWGRFRAWLRSAPRLWE